MASITRHGKRWRALVKVGGVRRSKVCDTKAQAQAWAVDVSRDLERGASTGPMLDAFRRYARDVSPTKRGARWEVLRLRVLGESALARVRMDRVSAADVTAWRDARLREVSAATVLRELTLIAHVCAVAVREWRWMAVNPCVGVRRPSAPAHRTRLLSADEVERMMIATGYDRAAPPHSVGARVGAAMLLAIETGMRAGELCGIRPGDIAGKVVTLPRTKNGSMREVPLSPEALRIVHQLRALELPTMLGLTVSQLDANWRKARKMAGIEDLHFHDTRHTAVTRLAKRLGVLELARMIGHRNISQLMVYYNESAASLAERL